MFNITLFSIVGPVSCNRYRHELYQLRLNRRLVNALTFIAPQNEDRILILMTLFTYLPFPWT